MQHVITAETTATRGPDAGRLFVQATWVLMLRWVAVAGQLITVLVASLGLGVELPYVRLVSLVAITAVTNLLFTAWIGWRKGRKDDETDARWLQQFLVGVMTLDLVLLTGLLYYSGGVANPFIVFYTVNLALAAILLPVRWAWLLTLAALTGIAFLTWWHKPLPDLAWPLADGGQLTLGRVGVLTAYATCAVVVTYFITQVSAELQRLEANLRIAQQKRAQARGSKHWRRWLRGRGTRWPRRSQPSPWWPMNCRGI